MKMVPKCRGTQGAHSPAGVKICTYFSETPYNQSNTGGCKKGKSDRLKAQAVQNGAYGEQEKEQLIVFSFCSLIIPSLALYKP